MRCRTLAVKAAALWNLGLNPSEKLLAHVNAISALFQERLSQMEFAQRATVRVKGLAIAVQLKDSLRRKIGKPLPGERVASNDPEKRADKCSRL